MGKKQEGSECPAEAGMQLVGELRCSCLWWDGVAVPRIMEAPARGCPPVGNLGPTWAPGLILVLSHAKARMVQDWRSQLLCFIVDGKKCQKF